MVVDIQALAAPIPNTVEKHEYYVDLGSYLIEAESGADAEQIVKEGIGSGELTVDIVGVGRNDIDG